MYADTLTADPFSRSISFRPRSYAPQHFQSLKENSFLKKLRRVRLMKNAQQMLMRYYVKIPKPSTYRDVTPVSQQERYNNGAPLLAPSIAATAAPKAGGGGAKAGGGGIMKALSAFASTLCSPPPGPVRGSGGTKRRSDMEVLHPDLA